jgi:DNA polymerase-3 subunit alpha
MNSLAISDHGAMYGALHFYLKCKEEGVKPIIGCETYVSRRGHLDKEGKLDTEPYHLLLLASNNQGYKNLLKLVSIAHLDGYYYKPRIDLDLLEKYHKGIIATSTCLQGQIPKYLRFGETDKAKELAGRMSDMLGEDNFYLELQDHPDIPEQGKLNEMIVKLGRDMGLPLIATNDAHYVSPDDAEAQEVLLCVQTQKTFLEKNRPLTMISSPDFYIKTPEEMEKAFLKYPVKPICENFVWKD